MNSNVSKEELNIETDIVIVVYAARINWKDGQKPLSKDEVEKAWATRGELLNSLGVEEFKEMYESNDDFWLFYEHHIFPAERFGELHQIIEKYKNTNISVDMDCLSPYTEEGTIELENEIRVSDPCYNMDVWCATTLKYVRPGTYRCFYKTNLHGRVAAIKVVHSDCDLVKCVPDNTISDTIGVDSGMCGIYNLTYFEETRGNEAWYNAVCDGRDAEIFDDKAFISGSGYGDGGYECKTYEENGEVVAVEVIFIDASDFYCKAEED